MKNESKKETFAKGARQLVVQLALETTSMFGFYVCSLTPTTNMGASADGADITTFLAPPCRICFLSEKISLKGDTNRYMVIRWR